MSNSTKDNSQTPASEDDIPAGKMNWTPSIELMLAKWCDQAKAFEWMHTEAYTYFDTRARIIAITSNIFAAISGLSNVIAGGAVVNGVQMAWVFGSLSIIVSITNMLQEKLAYNIRSTEHRQYSVAWGAVRRKIEEEIGIPPDARKECKTFMKYLRQDINQVSVEGNAKIPDFIKDDCFTKFSKIPNFTLPDICGELEHTQIYNKGVDEPVSINIYNSNNESIDAPLLNKNNQSVN